MAKDCVAIDFDSISTALTYMMQSESSLSIPFRMHSMNMIDICISHISMTLFHYYFTIRQSLMYGCNYPANKPNNIKYQTNVNTG